MENMPAWVQPTGFGLFVLVCLLVLAGRLVTFRQLQRELQREREISEDWKATAQANDARADKYAETLAELTGLVRTLVDRSRV